MEISKGVTGCEFQRVSYKYRDDYRGTENEADTAA